MPVVPSGRRRLLHGSAHRPRRLIAVLAPLVVIATIAFTANAATGVEPGQLPSIPDNAFREVVLPSPAASMLPAAAVLGQTPDQRTTQLEVLRDSFASAAPAGRAQPSLPAAKPIVKVVPPPLPKTTHSIKGYASYYCRAGVSPCTINHPDGSGFNAYAAAGPRLRAAIGPNWRGMTIVVDGIAVKLIDWCQCYQGESNEKLLDLYYDVFARTGSPVVVRW